MQIPEPPYILDQATAERLTKRRLPRELFNWPPLGHRLYVVLEPPKTRYGLIHVPGQAQKLPARGTVIAVGELVGRRWTPASGECIGYWPLTASVETPDGIRQTPAPWTLLGVRVLFSAYAGEALLIDPDEETNDDDKSWVDLLKEMNMDSLEWWKSPFKMMTDNDIIAPDWRTVRLPSSNDPSPLITKG